jgi:hypothetical protein
VLRCIQIISSTEHFRVFEDSLKITGATYWVQRERSARSRSKTQIDPESPTNIVDYLSKFSGALLGKPFQEGSRGAVGPNRLLAPSVGDHRRQLGAQCRQASAQRLTQMFEASCLEMRLRR